MLDHPPAVKSDSSNYVWAFYARRDIKANEFLEWDYYHGQAIPHAELKENPWLDMMKAKELGIVQTEVSLDIKEQQ